MKTMSLHKVGKYLKESLKSRDKRQIQATVFARARLTGQVIGDIAYCSACGMPTALSDIQLGHDYPNTPNDGSPRGAYSPANFILMDSVCNVALGNRVAHKTFRDRFPNPHIWDGMLLPDPGPMDISAIEAKWLKP